MKNETSKSAVKIRVIKAAELTATMQAAWNRILSENGELASPFFSPAYTRAVAEFVPATEIGVMEMDGKPVAFLPFERCGHQIAKRMRLSDYEGFVAPKGLHLDPQAFIKGCGLAAWDFNHLLAEQSALKPFHRELTASPIIDLAQGFDAYLEERRQSGRWDLIKRCNQMVRKIEREVGELRFEIHVDDKAILETVLNWRKAKYGEAQPFELLTGVLGKLMNEQSEFLKGTLSVLYAKDEVIAAHFGLRSPTAWHLWFPAYNPKFEKSSPGLVLIFKMAEQIAKSGTQIIDFGKGDRDYKTRFMNGSIPLAEGSVEVSLVLSFARTLKKGAKSWLRLAHGKTCVLLE
jgi:CelD/BcsL family acetyltransferase involved in cellulose biosynthesis